MVKRRNTLEDDSNRATKALWNDELTRTFCELCVKEVENGNRPTSYLNTQGWQNVLARFHDRTRILYGKPQLKNKWDTLKKEWKWWTELLKNASGLEWCPRKKTIDATNEWWTRIIQECPELKVFRKRGIDPELNNMLWCMFGDTGAVGKHASTPSSGVLPDGASTKCGDEGYGDRDINVSNKAENEVDLDTCMVGQKVVADGQDTEKKKIPARKSIEKKKTSSIEKLCDSINSPSKAIVFPPLCYGVEEAMGALRVMEDEIPPMSNLYYFGLELFHHQIKREIFLNLRQAERKWWLEREYEKHHVNARLSSLPSPLYGFQPFQQTPPS